MRRLTFGIAFLSVFLAATVALSATPGYTTAERVLATELQKRLIEKKKAADNLAQTFARVYLRRAYVVDVESAETVATELLTASGKGLPARDQLRYFGWSLDALARDAALADVRTAMAAVIKDCTGSERDFFLERFLGVADRYASPATLVALAKELDRNGLVGRRRQEFIAWVTEQVKLGEDPAIILRMYESISKIVVSVGAQTDYVRRFTEAIRRGVSPRSLAVAVEKLVAKNEVQRAFDKDYEQIMRLYFAGVPFDDAVKTVIPPPKVPAGPAPG